MIERPASEIARLVGGRLTGADVTVGPDVVLDSGQATPGALFVALRGRRVDGHDFADAASAGGAVAALVSRVVPAALSQIVVADPADALGALARHIAAEAKRNGLISLAVTGSSGKTSTKDLLSQVLELVGPTVAPPASFNNRVGLPVTVTAIDESTRFLVSEMGASGVGHIAYLVSIAAPTIAAVLNVGHAHLGEFGSQAAIAQAKGEIVESLPAGGWAVLNADDPLVAAMAGRTPAQVAWFSTGAAAPESPLWVRATDLRMDELDRASFQLTGRTPAGRFSERVGLRTLGAHQVGNACAAAAMALCAGLTPEQVVSGLNAAVARSRWRMELCRLDDGTIVVNDAYNANPDSVAAALASLSRLASNHRGAPVVAVLGDMLELGADAPELHEAMGRQAAQTGATVVAVGQFAEDTVRGASEAGGTALAMARQDVPGWLADRRGGIVLVKGSRGVGLEWVVEQLQEASE